MRRGGVLRLTATRHVMLPAPCLLPSVVGGAVCADWLAIAERHDASAHGSSLRLSSIDDIDLGRVWHALAASGVLQQCQRSLGPALACNIDQSWLRRQHPAGQHLPQHAPHGWHQDGALHFDFIAHERDRSGQPYPPDALLPMLTCWIALTPCGIDAPSLELVTQRLDALTPAAELTDTQLRRRFSASAFWRPALQPGDALLFGGDTLHRTHVSPAMTRTRTSIEFRFFAADPLPARLRAERFTPVAGPGAMPT